MGAVGCRTSTTSHSDLERVLVSMKRNRHFTLLLACVVTRTRRARARTHHVRIPPIRPLPHPRAALRRQTHLAPTQHPHSTLKYEEPLMDLVLAARHPAGHDALPHEPGGARSDLRTRCSVERSAHLLAARNRSMPAPALPSSRWRIGCARRSLVASESRDYRRGTSRFVDTTSA